MSSISELISGRDSKPPPPPWFRAPQETWQAITKAEVPVDSRAIWLAGYAHEELLSFNERCVDHPIMKRHFRLGVPYRAFEDLAWLKQRNTRELAAYRCDEDAATAPFLEFWKAWGFLFPHPLPAAWIASRSNLPVPAVHTPSHFGRAPEPADTFASFLRYAKLVRLPPPLVAAAFDLCVAG